MAQIANFNLFEVAGGKALVKIPSRKNREFLKEYKAEPIYLMAPRHNDETGEINRHTTSGLEFSSRLAPDGTYEVVHSIVDKQDHKILYTTYKE